MVYNLKEINENDSSGKCWFNDKTEIISAEQYKALEHEANLWEEKNRERGVDISD